MFLLCLVVLAQGHCSHHTTSAVFITESDSSSRKDTASCRFLCVDFAVKTMLRYFLDTVVGDGKSASNFKASSATDNKSSRIYERRYVQRIEAA